MAVIKNNNIRPPHYQCLWTQSNSSARPVHH